MKFGSIAHVYQVRLKTNFYWEKYYRTYMWHLNKVWSTNFVDDNATLAVEKIILLASSNIPGVKK
jgi:hypothetical protein